jgi:E3 ubiquitin-protein ligase synoviolin
VICMVYYAYYTRRQFYPTILYLVSSKTCFLVGGNLFFASALLFARLIKSLFFGTLREVETELLLEKAKYAIIETCLALTIFRNELTPTVFALFAFLIFFKLMHKLSKTRLEYFEQITPVPTFVLLRMGILLASLLAADSVALFFSIHAVIKKGRSVLILFGFEFGLLLIYTINLGLKFCFQLLDSYLTGGFQSRGFFTMVVDLVCETVKFLTYIALFCMIMASYGLPFHLIRDVYSAYYSFQRKLFSFIRYLQLTRNLDHRFPDATPEEITAAGSCLVCREEMTQGKKLKCGHVFHLECLRMWLQHQQSCPLCRYSQEEPYFFFLQLMCFLQGPKFPRRKRSRSGRG